MKQLVKFIEGIRQMKILYHTILKQSNYEHFDITEGDRTSKISLIKKIKERGLGYDSKFRNRTELLSLL